MDPGGLADRRVYSRALLSVHRAMQLDLWTAILRHKRPLLATHRPGRLRSSQRPISQSFAGRVLQF